MTLVHDAVALAENIAQRCQQAVLKGDTWEACCPAHDDTDPSLSITPSGDKVLIYCFAGCAPEAIMAKLGLNIGDLFVKSPVVTWDPTSTVKPRITTIYQYTDASGNVLHETVRYIPKNFKQRYPDPAKPGGYVWNLRGVQRVLYNLPAVLGAIASDQTVYIVEGEKDVETLRQLGLVATTNPMGASKPGEKPSRKWLPSFTETLRGANVTILPDNDDTGTPFMQYVAGCLSGVAASLKVIALHGLLDKQDVSDWLQAGHTRQDLEAEVQHAPAWAPTAPLWGSAATDHAVLCRGDSIQQEEMHYAWEPYLPRKMVSMLDGDPGVGKTGIACLLTAAVTRGHPLPDQAGVPMPQPDGPGDVLMVAMEDHLGAVIIPRLKAADADLSRVTFVTECENEQGEPRPFTLADLPLLTEYLERYRPRLVYIDAIQAVLGDKVDINRSNVVAQLMLSLRKLAETYDCAVLCSRHPSKPGQHVAKVLYRGMGSQAFIGGARSGLFVEEHPADDTRALLVHYKANTGLVGRTQLFSKEHGRFAWCGASRITHRMLAGDGTPGPLPIERLKAALWLEKRLRPGMPEKASVLYKEAEDDHDWSEKVLRKASEYLKVTKTQIQADFLWSLPPLSSSPSPTGLSGVSGSSGISGSSGVDCILLEQTSVQPDSLSYYVQATQDSQDSLDCLDDPDCPVVSGLNGDVSVNMSPWGNSLPLFKKNAAAESNGFGIAPVPGTPGSVAVEKTLPQVGDFCWLLSETGERQNVEEYFILQIETGADGQPHARFWETDDDWPLRLCVKAQPPVPTGDIEEC